MSSSSSLPPLGPHDHVAPNDPRALFPYDPSFGAAVLFAVLYGLTAVAHVAQGIRYRKAFCWIIIMSATWQFVGFILRIFSTRHQLAKGPYDAMQIIVLLAPLWTNAFCYMTLGRMIHFFLPERRLMGIPSTRFSLLWVTLDCIAFVIQAIGGAMIANNGRTPSDIRVQEDGLHVYMGGIGLQELFILLFLTISFFFYRAMVRAPAELIPPYNWRRLLYALWLVLGLITLRIIYRLVEFAGGARGSYVPDHEWVYYVFDAAMMLLAIWVFNIVHPGQFLVGPRSEFGKRAKNAEKQEGMAGRNV